MISNTVASENFNLKCRGWHATERRNGFYWNTDDADLAEERGFLFECLAVPNRLARFKKSLPAGYFDPPP